MASSPILRVRLKRSRPQQQEHSLTLHDDHATFYESSPLMYKRSNQNDNPFFDVDSNDDDDDNNTWYPSRTTHNVHTKRKSSSHHRRCIRTSCFSNTSNALDTTKLPPRSSSSSSTLRSCRSLPILFDQRQRGYWRHASLWRDRMLKKPQQVELSSDNHNDIKNSNNDSNNNIVHHRNNHQSSNPWRDYAQRVIPFSHLQTPHCDAVLALEQHGSYVIAVSEGDNIDCFTNYRTLQQPALVVAPARLTIRFHGVPTPSILKASRNQPRSRVGCGSVLLQSTPISWNVDQNSRAPQNHMLDIMESSSTSAASAPLRILLSADGRLGVVFLRQATSPASSSSSSHSLGTSILGQDDGLGSLTLFSLPRMNWGATGCLRTFQCVNVRIAAWDAFTMRNLLWPVSIVPITDTTTTKAARGSQSEIVRVRETPGYLLLNDEDDGFRLTWIVDRDWWKTASAGGGVHDVGESNLSVTPTRNDIVAVPERRAWEQCFNNDSDNPLNITQHADDDRIKIDGGITVISEAFLSVEALLSDILQRRKHLLPSRPITDARPVFPDFSYSLIATSPCGRMIDLIITFESKKSAAVAVFLRVDVFTQAYEEIDWIRNTATPTVVSNNNSNSNSNTRSNTSSLRKWSNLLALKRRARDMRVGPYSISPDHDFFGHWGPLPGDIFYENAAPAADDDPAKSQKQWHDYLDGLKWNASPDASLTPPTRISYKLLYPGCNVITNAAVIKGTPVLRMICQDSPIQIVYG